MKITKLNILVLVYIAILLVGITISYNKNDTYVDVFAMPATGKAVIIDAGHGGWGWGA